ncbi:MAG: hypothetical protein H7066_08495 [Cytophagaceae bacterium]|nr:hypothetical protein [Gemmatimonadaceae bacterium]
MRREAATIGGDVFAPSSRLATDNAAMIARAGLFRFEQGQRDDWSLNAYATQPLPSIPKAAAAGRP